METLSRWLGLGGGSGAGADFIGTVMGIGNTKLTIQRVIAEGGFGIVYVATDDARTKYAVKRLLTHDRAQAKAVKAEIQALQRVKDQGGHENIIRLLTAAKGEGDPRRQIQEYMIITPFYKEGTLFAYATERDRRLGLKRISVLFKQCASAVAFLHGLEPLIIHRDIKVLMPPASAENYFLTDDGDVKLGDFGSCTSERLNPANMSHREKVAAEEAILQVTTPQNRTPEMLDMHSEKPVDERVDIWALGCLLYTLCYRKHPFEEGNVLAICNLKYDLPTTDEKLEPFRQVIRKSPLTHSLSPSQHPLPPSLSLSLLFGHCPAHFLFFSHLLFAHDMFAPVNDHRLPQTDRTTFKGRPARSSLCIRSCPACVTESF
ncbi:uncharacterized protein MONBRDRAFT_30098 [Monosiga brevicollis MX1]|uniref:Protein kinase domain-containing protein n=1 Tax=Monosiga brevicollis TaxID=81824 RepID=A9VD09_MONBE|nr:uncharacterized protein MONBRDRAFT_30098 [Monosiga brevicollis MX1]EDQ84596.1 predicted protein [Monosiga brevicollis MX1]|eukprot:XP_001750623.1 hypothetical protein [Monosiga brevicollis MX1]